MLQRNFYASFNQAITQKEDSNELNLYTILFTYSWEFEYLCLISVAPIMTCVFVCNAVDVSKIVAVSSIKFPSYTYAQVITGQKLNHG